MRHLTLAVKGIGFDNKTGPSRRFEVAMCQPGEPVELRPEPKNPADEHAVAVYSTRGIQIGYVAADRAPLIRRAIERGGVSAIFQGSDQWFAFVRAHLDGTTPVLPATAGDAPAASVAVQNEPEWWPDEVYPDE